jgi:hypothetical protein
LLRILERIEKYARYKNKPVKGAIANKILGWFQRHRQAQEQPAAEQRSLTRTRQDGDTSAAADPSVKPPTPPPSSPTTVDDDDDDDDIGNSSPRRTSTTTNAAAAAVFRRLRFRRGGQSSSSSLSRGGGGGDGGDPDDMKICDCENYDDAARGGAADENETPGSRADVFGMENVILHSTGTWTIQGLGLTDVSKLFAWVLFAKDLRNLDAWERDELDLAFRIIGQERLGLVFHDDDDDNHRQPEPDDEWTLTAAEAVPPCEQQQQQQQQQLRPLLMSLEDVQISHKPLPIYLLVYMIKFATGAFLRCWGFRRIVTRSGLVAWFRPAILKQMKQQPNNDDGQELLQQQLPNLQPLLFFHGVSPAPLTICLPMILNGLAAARRRAVVLFENPTISWSLGFHTLSEQDTLDGVQQIVHEYLDTCHNSSSVEEKQQHLAIAGHSFGSCCITWLVRSHPALRDRIGQIILLDPVTILLSEPSVVVNFLYSKRRARWWDLLDIVSSELFTQYYIRRHFSWYNSELWLQDVPSDIPITIALSGRDDIVDAPSVREHILQFQQEHGTSRRGATELLYWPNLPHAMCIAFPDKWAQVEQAMLQQEFMSDTSQPARILSEVSGNAC